MRIVALIAVMAGTACGAEAQPAVARYVPLDGHRAMIRCVYTEANCIEMAYQSCPGGEPNILDRGSSVEGSGSAAGYGYRYAASSQTYTRHWIVFTCGHR